MDAHTPLVPRTGADHEDVERGAAFGNPRVHVYSSCIKSGIGGRKICRLPRFGGTRPCLDAAAPPLCDAAWIAGLGSCYWRLYRFDVPCSSLYFNWIVREHAY